MSSVHTSLQKGPKQPNRRRISLRSSPGLPIGRRLFLGSSATTLGVLLAPGRWNGSIVEAHEVGPAVSLPQLFNAACELEAQIVVALQTQGALEAHLGVESLAEEDAVFLREKLTDGLAILRQIPRLTLLEDVDLLTLQRRTFLIARQIADRVQQINPAIEDPLFQTFSVNITLFGVVNVVPWWIKLLILLALAAFAFIWWLSTRGDTQRAVTQALQRLLDVARGRIPDGNLGAFVQELVEQARRTLEPDKEMELCEEIIRRLQQEFDLTPPGTLRRRLGILLRELRSRWTRQS